LAAAGEADHFLPSDMEAEETPARLTPPALPPAILLHDMTEHATPEGDVSVKPPPIPTIAGLPVHPLVVKGLMPSKAKAEAKTVPIRRPLTRKWERPSGVPTDLGLTFVVILWSLIFVMALAVVPEVLSDPRVAAKIGELWLRASPFIQWVTAGLVSMIPVGLLDALVMSFWRRRQAQARAAALMGELPKLREVVGNLLPREVNVKGEVVQGRVTLTLLLNGENPDFDTGARSRERLLSPAATADLNDRQKFGDDPAYLVRELQARVIEDKIWLSENFSDAQATSAARRLGAHVGLLWGLFTVTNTPENEEILARYLTGLANLVMNGTNNSPQALRRFLADVWMGKEIIAHVARAVQVSDVDLTEDVDQAVLPVVHIPGRANSNDQGFALDALEAQIRKAETAGASGRFHLIAAVIDEKALAPSLTGRWGELKDRLANLRGRVVNESDVANSEGRYDLDQTLRALGVNPDPANLRIAVLSPLLGDWRMSPALAAVTQLLQIIGKMALVVESDEFDKMTTQADKIATQA
jgi:hypothetical protein